MTSGSESYKSWTDDLPRCMKTATAYYNYHHDISQSEDSDTFRSFYCQLEDGTCLYGIFDPHNGVDTAYFVLQRMAAEILLGQLNSKNTDDEIKDVLRNAFISVEKDYIQSIDEVIAKRTSLQYQLPEGLTPEKLSQDYSDILEDLKRIDERLSIGATAVIALIHGEKLFVANIGQSRALLCKTDENNVLKVVQLSVDHSLSNEDELLRLSKLGLDITLLRHADCLGNQSSTRCLGNYLIKGLYRAFPDIQNANSEPIISIPEVHGPVKLDESCRFLVLMSDGLYKSLETSTETEQVNKKFAQLVVEQFRTQKNLESVCKAVVNETVRIYTDHCSRNSESADINHRNTLLIRNFNFQMPNEIAANRQALLEKSKQTIKIIKKKQIVQEPSEKNSNSTVRFNPIVERHIDDDFNLPNATDSNLSESNISDENYTSTITSQFQDSMSTNTDTSSDIYPPNNKVPYDKNRRIPAYVDFSDYYKLVNKRRLDGTLPPGIDF